MLNVSETRIYMCVLYTVCSTYSYPYCICASRVKQCFVYLSVFLSACLSVCLCVCLFACLSLSVCLSVCLSVSLSVTVCGPELLYLLHTIMHFSIS